MFSVKIKKCSNPSYWYNDKIGQYIDIHDQIVYFGGYSRNLFEIISNHSIYNEIINSKDGMRISIDDSFKTIDLEDIKVYTERELKIKSLLGVGITKT